MKNYVTPEEINQARQLDLLTYLEHHDPGELVRLSNNTYTTRTHDSLKISNGRWFWWSRNTGGKTALDYLVSVKEMPFVQAVQYVNGLAGTVNSKPTSIGTIGKENVAKDKKKQFTLPAANENNDVIKRYLIYRGIDVPLLDYCIDKHFVYEDTKHNCVFVGYNKAGKAQHASLRGSSVERKFCGDVAGSDKRFTFKLMLSNKPDSLYIFESPIDLLSYITLYKYKNGRLPNVNCLSLSGIYHPTRRTETLPAALKQYLFDYNGVQNIAICLDSDNAGRRAAEYLRDALADAYNVDIRLPKKYKDYNDMLMAVNDKALPLISDASHRERGTVR